METNRFGPIVTGFDVATAVRNTVRVWAPDYLADVAESSGRVRGALPTFRSYYLLSDLDRFDEKQMPALSIGVADTPVITRSRQKYQVTWDVRLGIFVKGKDDETSLQLAMLYTAAVRTILIQKAGLGGDPRLGDYEPFAAGTTWESERYDVLDVDDSRTLGAGALVFGVTVEGVVDSGAGPLEPSGDPSTDPGDWPTVDPDKISVVIEAEE